MPGRFAVVIGINYQNESLAPSLAPEVAERAGLNPLQYAEADAIDVAAVLRNEGYAVETLIGAAATRRAIIDIIEQQSDAGRNPGDLLVVYFSGHGNVDRYRRPVAYLLPADADPQSLSATAIRLDDLAHHNLSMAHSVLTLLDCCHSGYAVGLKGEAIPDELGQEFGQQARNIFASVRGRIVLAACAGDQQARELRRLRHGAFTYYALEHWRRSPTV